MALYVTNLLPDQWKYGPSCMLLSDSLPCENGELHEFAAKLKLMRRWFQGPDYSDSPGGIPHYRLTKNKRAEALALGATPLSDGEFTLLHERWNKALRRCLKKARDHAGREDVMRRVYS